jgi:hypothetical protein
MFGFFGGGPKRNQPVEVPARRPVARNYKDSTGDAGVDGFTVISAAEYDGFDQGYRKPAGTPVPWGPRRED